MRVCTFSALVVVLGLAVSPALAQTNAQVKKPVTKPVAARVGATTPAAVKSEAATAAAEPSKRMVLEADTAIYDNDNNRVTAVGRVVVYYSGRRLTADKVTYMRQTERVIAEGNARLVSEDGTILTGQSMDVTRDFKDGFVNDLRIETIDRSRFGATTAKREGGKTTTFMGGVYSACQACVLEPQKPPFWQIKAVKIIHNQEERMVYYEDAHLEILGTSVAWLPFLSHPDPSVTRKTGLLIPTLVYSEKLGAGARVPYFWAPTPDWDVTFSPAYLSRQGFLADAELRHRTQNGSWSVRGMGINQMDPSAFDSRTSNRDWRGQFSTEAKFYLNQQWYWGWDATLMSDRRFAADYKVKSPNDTEASSSVFLTGLGNRNFFDARVSAFQVYTDDDATLPNGTGKFLQDKQPVAATLDYSYIHPDSVLGGEASARFNLTALEREKADLDLSQQVRGAAGSYGRMSADLKWRRETIDSLGQVWKPFMSMRGDFFFNHNTDPQAASWISDDTSARFMPTVGVEYRYPLLITSAFGSNILEPIVQLVARPNETRIGHLPNEDSQSLVFDDTTLFQADKFSGWDRAEGGVRANLGAQYTLLMENGTHLSMMLGESIHLAGLNSYATPTADQLLNDYALGRPLSTLDSGLDTRQSDFVGRIYIDTATGLRFGTQARVDNEDFKLNRLDVQGTAVTGPLTTSLTYSYLRTADIVYELLDDAGIDTSYWPSRIREEIQGAASLRASENWRLYGSVRYDMRNSFVVGSTVGLGYDNDSFSASLAYIEDTDTAQPILADGSRNVTDRTIYLRFGFRTLGVASVSNSLPTD